ncbi:MAG: DUF6265 family protein [Candidatus Latescibacterota bacterium]
MYRLSTTSITLTAAAVLGLAIVFTEDVLGQSTQTTHILTLDAGAPRPTASIEDVAWLAGQWAGEGLGGSIEETWNAPSGGTMLGSFKLLHGDEPSIYELELLTEVEGTLQWRVKHFDSSFHAWEDKEEFVVFPLVKIERDAAYFDGLTVRRDSGDQLTIFLAMQSDGGLREEQITLRRVR